MPFSPRSGNLAKSATASIATSRQGGNDTGSELRFLHYTQRYSNAHTVLVG